MREDIDSKGVHIPSLKIDRFGSILALKLPRLAQLNLIAGDNDILRSSLLRFLLENVPGNSRATQPEWWDHVELENDEELLISTSDRSGTLVMDAGEPFQDDRVEIRYLGHNLTTPIERFGKDWYFFLSNEPEVVEAGGLVEPMLLDRELHNTRRNAHLNSTTMRSISGFVIRARSGIFELGWFMGSAEDPKPDFVNLCEIGSDVAVPAGQCC